MTRKSAVKDKAAAPAAPPATAVATTIPKLSKLDRLEALLRREGGANLQQMMAETGWRQHSVRGAMAGALKKRGLAISSEKTDGERRYFAPAE